MNDMNSATLGNNNMIRKQLTNQANDLKEFASKLDFQRQKNDQLNQRIFALEKIEKDLLAEKEFLKDNIHTLDLRLARKKNKIQIERKENQDLIEKLGTYVDKDNISRNLIRNKNDDMEKYYVK